LTSHSYRYKGAGDGARGSVLGIPNSEIGPLTIYPVCL